MRVLINNKDFADELAIVKKDSISSIELSEAYTEMVLNGAMSMRGFMIGKKKNGDG